MMNSKFERLDEQFNRLEGEEAIIHVLCNGKSNDAYLPPEWTKHQMAGIMKGFIKKLKAYYGELTEVGITIIPADEFVKTSTPKEAAEKALRTLRDEYIKMYMNND